MGSPYQPHGPLSSRPSSSWRLQTGPPAAAALRKSPSRSPLCLPLRREERTAQAQVRMGINRCPGQGDLDTAPRVAPLHRRTRQSGSQALTQKRDSQEESLTKITRLERHGRTPQPWGLHCTDGGYNMEARKLMWRQRVHSCRL